MRKRKPSEWEWYYCTARYIYPAIYNTHDSIIAVLCFIYSVLSSITLYYPLLLCTPYFPLLLTIVSTLLYSIISIFSLTSY